MSSPQQVCRELLNLEPIPHMHRLTPRPYNVHNPNDSPIWWLVPATEFPSYRYAKVIVAKSNEWDGELEIGLHIEKGLGDKVRLAYPATKDAPLIMGSSADWAWRSLVAPGADVQLGMSIGKMTRPLYVRVQGAHVPPSGSFDPHTPRPDASVYLFEAAPPDSLSQHGRPEDAPGLLMPIKKAKSIAELLGGLRLLEANEWLWLDVELFGTWSATTTAKSVAREAWTSQLLHLTDLLFSIT